jgi:hypothetical protein
VKKHKRIGLWEFLRRLIEALEAIATALVSLEDMLHWETSEKEWDYEEEQNVTTTTRHSIMVLVERLVDALEDVSSDTDWIQTLAKRVGPRNDGRHNDTLYHALKDLKTPFMKQDKAGHSVYNQLGNIAAMLVIKDKDEAGAEVRRTLAGELVRLNRQGQPGVVRLAGSGRTRRQIEVQDVTFFDLVEKVADKYQEDETVTALRERVEKAKAELDKESF